MSHSRRKFLKNAGIVSVGAHIAPPGLNLSNPHTNELTNDRSEQERIVQTAIDSALSAGARYADARLSHFYATPRYETGARADSARWREEMGVGVRVLVGNSWGFAASPYWSVEEGARLGASAVNQARASVTAIENDVELAPHTDVKSGHWETPIKQDPFKMSPYEINDFDGGLNAFVKTLEHYDRGGVVDTSFSKIYKVFCSSHGQFTSQLFYTAQLRLKLIFERRGTAESSEGELEDYFPAGAGYEYMRDRPLREEHIRLLHEEALRDMALPWKPIEPGRYNILVDQPSMGLLLGATLGRATHADVVFTYHANSIGTSYINEPESMLGELKIGNSLLNVSCSRDNTGSVGTIGWDDEGVPPLRYNLVEDGILKNLQTHREAASWIKPYLSQSQQAYNSFGAAGSVSALYPQTITSADLTLKGSESPGNVDQLRQELENGIEIRLLESVDMDFQSSTGMTVKGRVYEIKNGKRVARLNNASAMFRTSELWSNLIRVGGQESVKYSSRMLYKGQPMQVFPYGLYTPPALFKEITFVDETRKA